MAALAPGSPAKGEGEAEGRAEARRRRLLADKGATEEPAARPRPLLLGLPEEPLLTLLAHCTPAELLTSVAVAALALQRLCLRAPLWSPRADIGPVPRGAARRLADAWGLALCQELHCRSLWPEVLARMPPLRSLVIAGRANCTDCGRALATLQELERLAVHAGIGRWIRSLLVGQELSGRCLARRLRALHVTTLDPGFCEAAELFPDAALFPALEELSWNIDHRRVSRGLRRAAYMRFLRRLGGAMGPGFERRRSAFRVGAYNGAALPPRLAVWCSLCNGPLFAEERIYALGPGTERHIDCEAFVWGGSAGRLLEDGGGQLHCPGRCHDEDDIFLVAGEGYGVDTCGFPFACACGPELAHLGPGPGDGGAWLRAFLALPGSALAPRRYRRQRDSAAGAAVAAVSAGGGAP